MMNANVESSLPSESDMNKMATAAAETLSDGDHHHPLPLDSQHHEVEAADTNRMRDAAVAGYKNGAADPNQLLFKEPTISDFLAKKCSPSVTSTPAPMASAISSSTSSSGGEGGGVGFSEKQIASICETLQQSGDIEKLANFLSSIPPEAAQLQGHEAVLRAKAVVAFHKRAFRELYAILENHNFDAKYHSELQKMWFEAHYEEAAEPCCTLEKYLLRTKCPLPKTIWDGDKTVYNFEEYSFTALVDSYLHNKYPPVDDIIFNLSQRTGLTLTQAKDRFRNHFYMRSCMRARAMGVRRGKIERKK